MANYAEINPSGVVVNVIDWDGDTVNNPFTPPSGFELVLDTDARVGIGWTYSNGVFSPPVTPPPTPQQLATAAMAAGLVVTSTSTPALNGTYGLDSNSQQNVIGTVTAILLTGNFPNGQTTMPWVDQNNVAHMWPSTTEFKAFATAFSTFVSNVALYAASNGAAGSIPSNEVTIP